MKVYEKGNSYVFSVNTNRSCTRPDIWTQTLEKEVLKNYLI